MSSTASENLLGYSVYKGNLDEIISEITDRVTAADSKTYLACFNPHSYAVSKRDADFSKSLLNARWLVPDGSGVVLASKILSGVITKRITGADIFYGLQRHLNKVDGIKVFFLGSSESNLKNIRLRMKQDFPNIEVVGTYSPPFKEVYSDSELQYMIDNINASGAQILWLGMTAPKQEKWIMQNIDSLNIIFAAAIGAVFDFYTGNVKRPSKIFCSAGLEWLPRLMREPKRLWRRTFISAPIFLADIIRQRFCRRSIF